MPWLPEFSIVLHMANTGRTPEADTTGLRDPSALDYSGLPPVGPEVVVHDPRAGKIEGGDAFQAFVASSRQWLAEREARTEWIASTATHGRAVGELVTHLMVDRRQVSLPMAVVAESRAKHPEFRIYYTQWPLLGRHTVRPPILGDEGVEPGGWPGKYHAALTAGDPEAIAAAFEPDGYFREPAGPDHVHRGEELLPFFRMFFSMGGGIHLQHCAITDDGIRCALEYNCVQWGVSPLPPQAGIGVYERGSTGKLRAARVYDDVEPPEFRA